MISIIIVLYKSKGTIFRCLSSIEKHVISKKDIIIIDNDSRDDVIDLINKEYPGIKTIGNKENLGFSKAVNQGIKLSKGDLILILNPDTVFFDDSYEKAIEYLKNNENTGIIGPRVIDGKGRFQCACRRGRVNPIGVLWRDLGFNRLIGGDFDNYNLMKVDNGSVMRVESISGSFMLIKREVFDKIGLFDEGFFLYSEDIDICLRAIRSGYDVIYFPLTTIIHLGAQSSKSVPIRSLWHKHISKIRFYNKHYSNNRFDSFFMSFLVITRFFILYFIHLFRKISCILT